MQTAIVQPGLQHRVHAETVVHGLFEAAQIAAQVAIMGERVFCGRLLCHAVVHDKVSPVDGPHHRVDCQVAMDIWNALGAEMLLYGRELAQTVVADRAWI